MFLLAARTEDEKRSWLSNLSEAINAARLTSRITEKRRFEGFLGKRGDYLKVFNLRYVVLKERALFFYAKKDKDEPIRSRIENLNRFAF